MREKYWSKYYKTTMAFASKRDEIQQTFRTTRQNADEF